MRPDTGRSACSSTQTMRPSSRPTCCPTPSESAAPGLADQLRYDMPSEDVSRSALSRRQFLTRGIAMSAVGLPILLEACAPAAPAAPTSAPPAAAKPTTPPAAATTAPTAAVKPTSPPAPVATTAAKPAGAMPTYLPLSSKPKADFPALDGRYEDGYLNYPANPTRSVVDAPGMGNT